MNNHVIDPTFFWDAIEEFSFEYEFYNLVSKDEVDEYGRRVEKYNKTTIRGSLQSLGEKVIRSKDGNTISKEYNFYCKSLYRIREGDVIYYKGDYLRCDSIDNDYDEMGVRAAHLVMIKLTSYRNLAEYVRYLKGCEIV